MVKTTAGAPVTMSSTPEKRTVNGNEETVVSVQLNCSVLTPGVYSLSFVLYDTGALGADQNIDVLRDVYSFSILSTPGFNHGMSWNSQWWGNVSLGDLNPME